MKIPLRQLERHLRDRLAPAYLLAGDEPLLVDEALAAVRAAAAANGFESRELHTADRGYRWAELVSDADNLSLFASRKVVEIRLQSPRPGDEGSRTIAELAAKRDPDRVLIVVVGEKLDSAATRAAWVKSLDEHGVLVEIWPIDRPELPRWVAERARREGLKLTSAAAQALAERVEGNLLAADQEIKRLRLLAGGSEVDEAQVLASVADNARFDVFRLSDAVLAGDGERAFRVLAGLQAEGVAAPLVSWALSREILLLARISAAIAHGENVDDVLQNLRVWRRRQPLVKQGVARFRRHDFKALIAHAAQVDGMVKGAEGARPWEALTGLLLALLRPARVH